MRFIFKHVIFTLLIMGIFSPSKGIENLECFECNGDGLDNDCNKGINLTSTPCKTGKKDYRCIKAAITNIETNGMNVFRLCDTLAELKRFFSISGTKECEEVRYHPDMKVYICVCNNSNNCNSGLIKPIPATTTSTTTTTTSTTTTTTITPRTSCVQSFNEQRPLFQFSIISFGVIIQFGFNQ